MSLYRTFAWPFIRQLDAEAAHKLTLNLLQTGLVPASGHVDDPVLATTLFGRALGNPVGLAAGFDKNALVPDAMLRLGFGFVEVGGVTPKPQPGNPQPRLFRLEEDRAIVNRMGFNNEGLEVMAQRLQRRARLGVVGANLGANKDSPDRPGDYAILYERLAPLVDFCVVNVSSPNTPGLRNLQGREELSALLGRLQPLHGKLKTPLLVKIAPDLADEDIRDVAQLALDHRLDGIVATNTTIARPASLRSRHAGETGGLSGAPLRERATEVLRELYRQVGGKLTLIGVGGIASGADAYARIRAGADVVQLYSALVYEGPGLVTRIRRELAALLKRDGFRSLKDAVGADHK
ncbi:MAG TPA: quinone-dependent dihydroorotate dehydrogenase [Ferrovibrio sp.]|uniref:quinone-dependent dihydroorotate dehydrogenase n=1 Tax=Ferrovibrio sp. TaxID=1917215 RepID=UPI002B4B5F91|nr:quinone-dependent dihydroorotate dehydrogenase [Ferrovibrio sp.]HLT75953.1 quinone-dependent dihydroorotate dehydrogenase [Ferrovibrio sp.]